MNRQDLEQQARTLFSRYLHEDLAFCEQAAKSFAGAEYNPHAEEKICQDLLDKLGWEQKDREAEVVKLCRSEPGCEKEMLAQVRILNQRKKKTVEGVMRRWGHAVINAITESPEEEMRRRVAPLRAQIKQQIGKIERPAKLEMKGKVESQNVRPKGKNTEDGFFGEEQQQEESAGNIFRKAGSKWTVAYEGEPPLSLDDLKGMHYIAYMLGRPSKKGYPLVQVTPFELVQFMEKQEYTPRSDLLKVLPKNKLVISYSVNIMWAKSAQWLHLNLSDEPR